MSAASRIGPPYPTRSGLEGKAVGHRDRKELQHDHRRPRRRAQPQQPTGAERRARRRARAARAPRSSSARATLSGRRRPLSWTSRAAAPRRGRAPRAPRPRSRRAPAPGTVERARPRPRTLLTRIVPAVRVLVVANPRATATSARASATSSRTRWPATPTCEIAETANRGHAAALACRAMRDGTDVVVALGGDGTVNEVVNGLLTDGVHPSVPALGVVPAGSTNVFARALGLPNDPVEATGALLEALRAGSHRPVSLGQADDRWFIFAAGLGYDAAVVAGVERHRRRGTTLDAPALRAGRRSARSSQTTAGIPSCTSSCPTAPVSTTCTSPSWPTPTRGRSSATARCARRRRSPSTAGSASTPGAGWARPACCSRMARLSGNRAADRPARRPRRPRPGRSHGLVGRADAVPGRRRLPRRAEQVHFRSSAGAIRVVV